MTKITFNFIINCTDSELAEYKKKDVTHDAALFSKYDLEWCLQAYLILLERNNLRVVCSNSLMNDAINIVHSAQLLPLKGNLSHFIVCVRADFPKRRWAHYHLVQNKNQLEANTSLVPLWIQPGLIQRNPRRKGVERVAYAGQTFNGNLAGSIDTWENLFGSHGVEFITLPSGACNDLSSIDVLIGIRSFDSNPHNTKPPSKLINAWHAHIPFIGGYDSAFLQVGTPGEDYLMVKTPQEVIEAVLQLREDAELYTKLVVNGKRKALQYTTQTIAAKWEDILTGAVLQRYEQWKSRRGYEQVRFNTLLRAGIWEHQSKQFVKKLISMK